MLQCGKVAIDRHLLKEQNIKQPVFFKQVPDGLCRKPGYTVFTSVAHVCPSC